jgi:HlyD family secretion protein
LKKALIPIALVILAGAAWQYGRRPDIPSVPFAKVVRETLVSTLPTNGKVEPSAWESVRAEAAGLVERLSLQTGQAVVKGAEIGALRLAGAPPDLAKAEAQIAEAQARLAVIERGGRRTDLAEIESGLRRLQFQKQTAQQEFDALARLAKKNAATRVEVEIARNKLAEIQIEIDALGKKKASLTTADDKTVAEAQLRQAEAEAAQARRRMSQAVVRAPISGVVYSVAARPGAYLNAGDLIANIGKLTSLRVRVYVDEPELGRVAVGQPVNITWDALPGVTWKGEVDKLPAEVIALGTRQVGEVFCSIENANGKLAPGTNVTAEIRTNVAPGALTIPKEAIRREGAETGVLVLRGDRVAWQGVEPGASSATRTEVKSGLKEGDSVALPVERPLKADDRVRPVYP